MRTVLSMTAVLSAVGLMTAACPSSSTESPAPRRVGVEVNASGYEPSTVQARAGERIVLVFKRTTEEGCGQELVFPDLSIKRDLPLNEAVEVELTPTADGEISFTCGMGMYQGSVVASTQ